MHSIRLNVQDSVLNKLMAFLQNLPKHEVTIVEDIVITKQDKECSSSSEIKAFSNHSANLIQEWQDEDEIWK
jgi:hypothetical protein